MKPLHIQITFLLNISVVVWGLVKIFLNNSEIHYLTDVPQFGAKDDVLEEAVQTIISDIFTFLVCSGKEMKNR